MAEGTTETTTTTTAPGGGTGGTPATTEGQGTTGQGTTTVAAGTEQTTTTGQGTQATGQAAGQESPATGTDASGDWRASITDPAIRAVADRFTSPAAMAKGLYDTRNALTQSVRYPDEKATDEDKARFRKALGIPEDGKYEVKLPEGVEMTAEDKAFLDEIMPIAFESNIPAKALNEFVAKYMAKSEQKKGEFIKQISDFQSTSERNLKREWGSDFDVNLNMASRAAAAMGGEDFKAFLNSVTITGGGLLGDAPEMIRFMATVGRQMGESDLGLMTPQERASVQDQISALMREVPVGSPEYVSPAHQARLQALYDKQYGKGAIVGGGRTV